MKARNILLKGVLKFGLGFILVIAFLELNNTHYSKHLLFSGDFFFVNNTTALLVLFNLAVDVTKGGKLLFIKRMLQIGLSIILGANILFWIYRLLIFFNWTEFFYCLFFAVCSLHIFIRLDGLFPCKLSSKK
jgi:hypothetical protein